MKSIFASRIAWLFGKALDATGLRASIANQCQRVACMSKTDEVPSPAPGTPLIVDLCWLAEHSGIYLGNGRVAELFGDNLLREVTLREFLEGEKGSHARTGRRIFAACSRLSGRSLSSPYAVENARAYIRRIRTVDYDLMRNNCHLFSISCISGRFQEKVSIPEFLARGGVSIGTLTHAISYFLNSQNDVIWKPVQGWSRESLGACIVDDVQEKRCENALRSRISEIDEHPGDGAIDNAKFDATVQKAVVRNGVFAPCLDYVKLAYKTVRDCISGRRTDIPWSIVVSTLAALLYFISPFDLIPDLVPVVGYADDAAIFLKAFALLLQYVDIPLELASGMLNVDLRILQWIKGLGAAGGELAHETQELDVKRDFDISASLLEYYGRRLGVTIPFEMGTLAKTSPVVSAWKKWPECNGHNWALQFSNFGFGARIVDPYGCVCSWGRKLKMRRVFDKFIAWYDSELLPRIFAEKV